MPGRGGLIGMLGTPIGMAAEYHEHRKQKKALSRENSEQHVGGQNTAGPSSQSQRAAITPLSAPDLPPAYDDIEPSASSRSLASGGPPLADKKAALGQYEDEVDEPDALYFEEGHIPLEVDDEEVWDLDEAVSRERGGGSPSSEEDEANVPRGREEDLVREVFEANNTALASAKELGFETSPIPVPVIIPQRRPRKKARGFAHAYAPLLGECSGISQETFLLFLKNFHKSSQASPIFPVIFIAAAIAGTVPSVIAMAVTTVVQVAAQTGAEIQSRQRTNSFLDKMNEGLFKPAGLFAMIVKYKSDREVAESGNSLLMRLGVSGEKADLTTNQLIAKFDRSLSGESGESRTMGQKMQGLRLASDTTKGTMAMPAAAPLIFPEIDAAVATEGEQTFKEKAKDVHGFLTDYMDRRAQVNYARDDPNSALNLPSEQRAFKSKLADPTHPMYNGGIIGFVSGGALTRDTRRQDGLYSTNADRMYPKRAYKDDRRMLKYEHRLDSGRGLSRMRERRYDEIQASRGYGSGYEDDLGRGFGRAGGRRRGGGGPIGLLVKGVGAAVSAAQQRGQPDEKSSEYEDLYYSRPAPGDQREMRRSADERRSGYGGPAPHAPYGGQSSSSPAPYGGRQPSPYAQRTRRQGGGGPGGVLKVVKKVMTEDVLYLMIVNMPSEEELAEARETLARAKANK